MEKTRAEVPVEELVIRTSALEEHLRALQKVIESYTDALISIKAAKELVKSLGEGRSGNIIVSGDKRANLLFKAAITGEAALVHIGLNIYAEADSAFALKVLDSKEKIVSEQLDRVKKEYESRAKEYKRLQDVIYTLSSQQG